MQKTLGVASHWRSLKKNFAIWLHSYTSLLFFQSVINIGFWRGVCIQKKQKKQHTKHPSPKESRKNTHRFPCFFFLPDGRPLCKVNVINSMRHGRSASNFESMSGREFRSRMIRWRKTEKQQVFFLGGEWSQLAVKCWLELVVFFAF